MKKIWNMTMYRDGKAVGEHRGVSQRDALTQMYFLSRTGVPLEAVKELRRSGPGASEFDSA